MVLPRRFLGMYGHRLAMLKFQVQLYIQSVQVQVPRPASHELWMCLASMDLPD